MEGRDIGVSCQQNADQLRVVFLQTMQNIEAISSWHRVIEEDHVLVVSGYGGFGLEGVAQCGDRQVAPKRALECAQDGEVVVDHQHSSLYVFSHFEISIALPLAES